MIQEKPRVSLPIRLANTLIRATGTADLETALLKVVNEYIEMKIAQQEAIIARMEEKWKMPLTEFEQRSKDNTLGKDPYSYEVERDYWEWEAAVTRLEHYKSIP